jgi:hypothetical protein
MDGVRGVRRPGLLPDEVVDEVPVGASVVMIVGGATAPAPAGSAGSDPGSTFCSMNRRIA